MKHGEKAQRKARQFYLMMGIFLCQTLLIHPRENNHIVLGVKANIDSHILGKEIQISVHVPDSHTDSDERYPVLYTFQTHFEQVAGAVKNPYDYGLIPKTIVVRVDNYEFGYLTPTKVASDPNSGKADLFLRFFKEELFPFIDSR